MTDNPEELYDEWIPSERLAAYDTPRARAQRQERELNRLGYELLKTINWETYNREAFQEAVKKIYQLGYDAAKRA